MSYLNNLIRTGRSPQGRFWSVLRRAAPVLFLLISSAAMAQKPTLPASPTACDYTAPANFTLTAQNVPGGYSTVYLLVNLNSGLIAQVNTVAPSFTSVVQGDYYAVPLHYTGVLSNAQAGKLVSDVVSSDMCMTYGTALALRVCPAVANCDYAAAPATVTFTANSVPGGVTTSYVLVNTATNLIAAVGSSPSVPGVPLGDYAITSIHYTGSLTALTVGNRLYDVATENENCLSVSNSIYVKVCNGPPTVAILTPTQNSTITQTPTVSGTATPGSTVTVYSPNLNPLLPPVQFCQTTASATGAWSCSGLMLLTGSQTITAIASNTNGVSTPDTKTVTIAPGANICAITLPILLPLGQALVIPNYCPTPTWIYYKDTPVATSAYMAIDPNGNAWNPSSLAIDATSVTNHTATSGSNTTQLAFRMFHINAPGSFTVNGGVKVRLYYNPAEFAGLPPNQTWFKHTAHLKTAVLGDLTATSLTNAISVTPNATGTELGVGNVQVAYVEFWNVTGFSTYGYMGQSSGDLPTIAITGPPNNSTATTTPTVSGTATPGSVVNVTGPGGATLCSATATAGGSWSCTVNVPPGSTTLTAVACTSVGCATATTSFTAVPPASLTVAPTGPITTTAPVVSGTATPGSQVVITGPGPVTLCTTTADAVSGTFSCPVTVPEGPNTLTVTACTSAGCSTTTTSFTAVGPPTVAIQTPAVNSTATSSPTVSGTATPGSVVTLTKPDGTTLCTTTATAGGSWSCMVSVLPGSNTVIATACNVAGCATATTSFTVTTIDSDGDGVNDLVDIDRDNDGITDLAEDCKGYIAQNADGVWKGKTASTVTYTWANAPASQTTVQAFNDPQTNWYINQTTGNGAGSDARRAVFGSTSFTISFSPAVPAQEIGFYIEDVDPSILSPGSNSAISYSISVNGGVGSPNFRQVLVAPTPALLYNAGLGTLTPNTLANDQYVALRGVGTELVSSIVVSGTVQDGGDFIAYSWFARQECDTDNDGTPNTLDRDSDNDGCSDAFEGGSTTALTANYSFTGAVGANGLVNTLESDDTSSATTTYPSTYTQNAVNSAIKSCLPTVAIVSPANNGTATTSPTVSGTATPGSIVTLTKPDGTTLCTTTATAGGSWSCAVSVPPGSNTVIATACNLGGCGTATTSFTAIAPNLPPVAQSDIANTVSGTPVTGNVLTNDSDPQSGPLTASLLSQPTNGTVTMSPNGSYTYTPPANFTGTETFCYSVSNTAGLSSSACVTVNVSPVPTVGNDAPVANNDNTQTTQGQAVTINVAANDTDPDSNTTLNGQLNAPTIVSQPAQGTASVVNGQVVYTPPANFTGVVSFPYSICDKGTPALCSTALVSVNVQPTPPVGTTLAPVAIDDALIATKGTPTTGTVAANDTDPNAPVLPLSFTSGQPTNGTVVMSANGSYTYTPAPGFTGPDSFTYQVCNTAAKCDVATVSVNVQPEVTTPPSITINGPSNTTATTTPVIAGTATPGSIVTLTKPDGTTLCTTTATAGGSWSCNVTVLPGSNTVTAVACTSTGCATANTSFTAVGPPSVTITNPGNGGMMANLTHPTYGTATPGASVTILGPNSQTCTTTADASSGTYVCGSFSYTPGQNSLTAIASNAGGTATAVSTFTVIAPSSITVLSPNNVVTTTSNPPISGTATPGASVSILGPNNQVCTTTADPVSGTYSCNSLTFVDGPAQVTALAGSVNGSQASSAVVTNFTVTTPPSITINGPSNTTATTTPVIAGTATPGSIVTLTKPDGTTLCTTTATAGGSWSCAVSVAPGSNTVIATACNGVGCATATTSFTAVGTPLPPVAQSDIANTISGTPVSGNVLTNDTDPQNSPLTASLLSQPTNGTVTMSPNGSYTYTPPANFTGTETFCYSVSNTAGLSSSACVSVNVSPAAPVANANNRPVANNDNTQTTAGTSVTINVAANDTDPDSNTTLNGQLDVPTIVSQPAQGTASVVNGQVVYTPPPIFTGVVSFPYQICDKGTPALCSTALVSVNVQPTPPVGTTLAPVAIDDALIATKGTPTTGTVAANDTDPNGPVLPLSFTSGQPANGTVVMSANGSYTYTPAPGFTGPDSFTYQVCNTAAKCDVATVSVNVQPAPNQAPQVQPDFKDVIAGVPATGNVLTNDKDPESTPLTASVIGTPPPGFTMTPDGSYTYTAPTGTTAPVTVPIQVCDAGTPPMCVTTTLTLVPVPPSTTANDAPIANPDSPRTTAGVPVTANVLANDVDPEGQPLSNPTIVAGPTNGTAVVNPNGTVSYTPAAGFTGTDKLTYSVCDGGSPAMCSTAVVTFTVDPTPPAGVTNTAPVALDDALLTTAGTSKTSTVAANDSDPQGQPLTYTKLSNPTNGTVVFNGDGSYTYTPPTGFTGTESFTYQVCDNASPALCATATAYLTVQPEVMTPPSVTINGPSNTTATTSPVIAGTATPGAVVTLTKPDGTTLCQTTATAGGSWSCAVRVPPGSNTVVATACNGVGCATATTSFTAVGTPLPPVAQSDIANTVSGTPVTGNVLTNDTDPQNGPLTASLLSQPTNGTVTMSPNGSYTYTPPANFTGTETFCYSVSNTAGLSSSACVTVNVSPSAPVANANNRPVANNDNTQTTAGTSVTINVAANDTDPDSATTLNGQLNAPTIVSQPAQGTASVVNGQVVYTPPANFTGVVSFPYQICDKGTPALCSTALVSVNVQPTPPIGTTLAPVAIDDALIATKGTPTTGTVAANDTDPNSPALPLSFTSGQPTNGTVVMSANGSYTYTPAPGFTGPDSFTYQVCNTAGKCDLATVSVNVQPAPNQAPQVQPDFKDVIAGVPATGNVLTNDKDPESTPLTASVIGTPPPGFTMTPDGSYTYTAPTGTTAPVTVPIQVCDSGTPPMCVTTTLTLVPVPPSTTANDAPIANPDSPRTTAGVPVTANVLANDVDPEGQPLSNPTIVAGPTNGTAVVNPNGTVSYTPAAGFTGTDKLTYSVCDGGSPAMCSTAQVTFTVDPTLPVGTTNTAPVALDDALLTTAGTSKTGTVSANDSDPQGQPLTYTKLSGPTAGTVVFSPTGSYTYTPPTGFTGTESFTYQVCDNASPSLCATATAYLTVQPSATTAAAPQVTPDIANTTQDIPVTGNVLTNDTNPQGGPLTATLLSQPTNGTVVMNPDGSYQYTPPTGFTGTATFCYSASNSAGLSGSACVTVNVSPAPVANVNNRPVANNDNTQTTAGTSVTINVAANDTDPDSATSLNGQLNAPTIVSQPTQGTATVVNGQVVYTPPVGFTGVTSFPYQICDKGTPSLCTTALVSVDVQPTPPVGTTLAPVAIDDALITTRNTSGTGTVAANDSDPNTPPLPLTYTSGQPQYGTVVMSPTGSYTYTPITDFVGPDTFTYTVCNTAGKCDVATVSVNVQPTPNQAPLVQPDFKDVIAGVPATGNVLTNDRDPEGTPLTASVVGTPPAGFTMTPDGSYTYTAPSGTTAPVTVPIQVCDGATPPMCVTTTLTLVPVPPSTTANDAPIANPDAPRTTAGVPLTVNVLANDVDPEGQPLSNPTIVAGPSNGTAVVNPNGTVSYTPAAGFTGTDKLTYSVCDGGSPAMCSTAVVTFTVDPTPPAGVTNTAPVALDDALLTGVNTSKTATVAANDSDPQNQPLTFTKLTNPANGTVVFSPTGSYTFTPASGFAGTDQFTYQVCDNASPSLCATATAYLTVEPQPNEAPKVTPDFNNVVAGIPATGNVLTNDRDPEGTPLTASVVGTPPAGLTMSPNGSYTYTAPVGTTAPVTVPIQVCDTGVPPMCTTTTLTLVPVPPANPLVNNPPVANPDSPKTTAGVPVTANVLANDVDPEGQPLSNPTIVAGPTNGTAVVNPNGTVSYTPAAGFTGTDKLTYSVCDGGTPPACSTAVVTFTVDPTLPVGTTNTAPVAQDDALITTLNTSKTATVASNDSDPQNQPLTFAKLSNPTNGTVVFSPTGSYTYTPATGYVGSDKFTYQVCDNASPSLCTTATAYLTVQPAANQAPQVTPDFKDVIAGVPATGNVLTNDKDPEGTPLTASVIGTPPAGFTLTPDGSYTYTAPVGTTAPVTVSIQVCDGATPPMCVTTTLTLVPVPPSTTANDAPIANPDAPRTTAGVPLTVNVLANDVDPEGQPLSNPTIVAGPSNGTAVVNPNGTVSYTPAAGFTGTDKLTYSVCDGGSPAMCTTAVVTFTVDPTLPVGTTNTAPVALDDALLSTAGTSKTATVSANDSDPQGQPLTYTKLSGPTAGTVVFSPTGSYTYTPPVGFTGTESFTYQVCDNASPSLCATATAYLTVQPEPSTPPSVTILSPTTNGTATTTPTIAGTATPGSVVTLTKPDGSTLCTTTATAGGSWSCAVTVPPGSNTVTATACTSVGCSSATTSFTAVPPASLTVAPTGPTTTTAPVISGTATPGAPVIIVGPNPSGPGVTTLCSTTANAVSGTFACPVSVTSGPNVLTVIACTSAGCSTTTTSFTAVVPPTVAILSPATNGTSTTTPTVTGTATPGSEVVLTTPTGATLCTTTATAGGSWSCAVNVPPGSTTLTATACNPAGCTTTTTNFTAVGPVSLTLAPTGPTTTTAPVISGTATPGAPVIIVGPNPTGPGVTTLCSTTASIVSGTFACTVTVPDGPNTLTVTACLASSCTSATTSFTAVAPPSVTILSPTTNGTATTTPTIAGTATPGSVVNVTTPTGATLCTTTATAGGSWSCTVNVPPGSNTLTATACTSVGCSSATTSFTAVPPASLTVAPTGPTTTTAPVISGTATPGAPVVITGPGPVTLCSTTADAVSGTFACPVSVTSGPNTLTVTACTSAGCSTTTTSFTAVAPPSVTILSPATNGTATTTPAVTGTATPGSTVVLTNPQGATVCSTSVSATGSWTCTVQVPPGSTTLNAVACNGAGCTTATTSFTAVGPALPPVVTPDVANTTKDKPVSGNVLTNDTDPQNGTLTASLTTPPTAGTVTLSPNGSYTYTPPTGFTGTTSFCYTASNTAGLSGSACVTVNVNPLPSTTGNNPPIATNDNTKTRVNVPVSITVVANDADPDSPTTLNGQLDKPTILSQPAQGTAIANPDGTFTYIPPTGYTGVATFPYSICDKGTPALCATAVVTVTILPAPPPGQLLPPVVVDDALLVTTGTPTTGTVAGNDSDPQSLPLSFSSGQPGQGSVVMNPNGTYTYSPAPGYTGPDSFTYLACNSAMLCEKGTVSVLVTKAPDPVAVLRVKVLLQGAMINGTDGLMRDDLRSKGFLPTLEPYTTIGGTRFAHSGGGGGETMPASVTAQNVGTGDAVVDWVFVELRDPNNYSAVVATRSALVQRDGDVVLASDGVSPLSFSGLPGSSYYVSVKHRNHLGVMTATAIPLSTTGTIVDFTSMNSSQTWNTIIGVFNYDGWEQTTVSSKQALWAGDANHNGKVKYQGTASDLTTIFAEVIAAQPSNPNPLYNYDNAFGYYFGDVNLDGKVKYQGTANDTSLIFTNIISNYRNSTQMNSAQLYNFDFMLEQIP